MAASATENSRERQAFRVVAHRSSAVAESARFAIHITVAHLLVAVDGVTAHNQPSTRSHNNETAAQNLFTASINPLAADPLVRFGEPCRQSAFLC